MAIFIFFFTLVHLWCWHLFVYYAIILIIKFILGLLKSELRNAVFSKVALRTIRVVSRKVIHFFSFFCFGILSIILDLSMYDLLWCNLGYSYLFYAYKIIVLWRWKSWMCDILHQMLFICWSEGSTLSVLVPIGCRLGWLLAFVLQFFLLFIEFIHWHLMIGDKMTRNQTKLFYKHMRTAYLICGHT